MEEHYMGHERSMEPVAKQTFDQIVEVAHTVLRDQGSHPAVFFVGGKDGSAMAPLTETDFVYGAAFAAGFTSAHIHPYYVVFVSEGWLSKGVPSRGEDIRNMPDTQECLRVVMQDRRGETMSVITPFTRIANEVYLGETLPSVEITFSVLDVFWEGVRQGEQASAQQDE